MDKRGRIEWKKGLDLGKKGIIDQGFKIWEVLTETLRKHVNSSKLLKS